MMHVCLILLSLFSTLFGSTKELLKEELLKILQETNTAGMTFAIVYKDGTIWTEGLGKADLVNDRMVSSETLFRVGSTSKSFVALSVLKLVEEGKLSLEDQVHTLAPEVEFNNPWEATDPVRIVHLLEHTAGWDNMHLRELAKDAEGMSLLESFDFHPKSRISRWRPGTRTAYCNSGPPVAAYIVEKITGQKFEDYVRENFFIPIGMDTATYFQPARDLLTTLYHKDGKTPYEYWNILYRPTGSLNASAQDMARYLLFYLNRGKVNGKTVIPSHAIDRMENPRTTWAAEEGLKAGYGLCNFWSIYEGFVYHGHDGAVKGGLTQLDYKDDVGYFFSLNSSSGVAFEKVGKLIRAYITDGKTPPPLAPLEPLGAHVTDYSGWYELDSPLTQSLYFLTRLTSMSYISFTGNQMNLVSFAGKGIFFSVGNNEFRFAPKKSPHDPVATAKLLEPNKEGRFIQIGEGMVTIKKIPIWMVILQIGAIAFISLSIISLFLYAPFWIFNRKKWDPIRFSPYLQHSFFSLSLLSGI